MALQRELECLFAGGVTDYEGDGDAYGTPPDDMSAFWSVAGSGAPRRFGPRETDGKRERFARTKAPSSLRFAGAVQGRIASFPDSNAAPSMKIAVVGCGALGSYYGAKLCRDGQEVHFLLRSDYDVVRRRGVTIVSKEGDFNVRPRCARTPHDIGVVDLVLVGLKTTANDQLPMLLPPLAGPRTAVLTLQNGLGNEEKLAELFPVEQILGGLCFVCLNRLEPGVIHHLDHGRIVLGEFRRWPEPRTHDIASMFRHAGVPCKVTDDLASAHWEKLVWNIPFNGLGVASSVGLEAFLQGETGQPSLRGPCLTTDQLLAEPRWEQIVRELMHEVVAAAHAQGLKVDEAVVEKQISRTRTMGAYKASTLIDFERGLPLELESLFLEPLRLAQQARVATPRLAALCAVLRDLGGR